MGGRVTRLPQRLGSTRGSFLDGIAMGADGNIWLTEAGRASVSSIDRVKLH
jgi:streptogramin lyase